MKGVIERLLALILILVLFPVFFVIWMVVWTENGSPVLFRQTRVGRDGKLFTVYKFRTMHNKPWPIEHVEADNPRITRPGKFLRKTHLDELPQLWNIVRGEMTFVGPRPQVPSLVQIYTELYPRRYGKRFQLLPGMTGLAQLYTEKGNFQDLAHYIALDELYRQKRSFCLDARILLRTIKKVWDGTSR